MTMALGSITLDELVAETVWLRRLAGSLVTDQADDVVHDTLLVASERAPTDRPLRPWLARVLVNRVRMLARGGSRRKRRETAVGELAAEPARPDELVDRIQLHRALAEYVLELPQHERDVVLLHYFEGLTSIEIGNRLGISAGTVRWRLKHAVDDLRERLDARVPNRAWLAPMLGLAKSSGGATATISSFVLAALAAIAVIVALLAMPRSAPAANPSAAATPATAASVTSAQPETQASPAAPATEATPGPFLDHRRIAGVVHDRDGRAVAGVDVRVSCRNYNDELVASMRTAADGRFAFEIDRECWYELVGTTDDAIAWPMRSAGQDDEAAITMLLLPDAPVLVHVVDARSGAPLVGAHLTGRLSFERWTTDAAGIARVRWAFGASVQVEMPSYVTKRADISAASPEHTIRLERGVEVSGVVLEPDSHPVPGASVSLIGPIDRDVYDRHRSVTDEAGMFAVSVPRAGRYRFLTGREMFHETAAEQINVGPDGRADLIAEIDRATEITGTVVDAAGKPVAGARVRSNDYGKPTVTDAHGRFAIRDPGSHVALIAHRGDQASTWYPVGVAPGEHAEVELRLGPGGVTGIVVDPSGAPVSHAEVLLNCCCDEVVVVQTASTYTDERGRFALQTPRGELRLSMRRTADDEFEDDDDVHVQGGARDVRLVLP
jgi:RNA polymerase sigma-70 factor (ECF subfamily)